MAADNGSGNGGGNSSVWWEIRHGSEKKKQQLEAVGFGAPVTASAAGVGVIQRPAAGQVKLSSSADRSHSRLEIHDRTGLADIGAPDHTGMFRVRLRIRKAGMDALIAGEKDPDRRKKLEAYRAALPELARTLQRFTGPPPLAEGEVAADEDVYLVVDVPAIERKPGDGKPWPDLPWEIYWQW